MSRSLSSIVVMLVLGCLVGCSSGETQEVGRSNGVGAGEQATSSENGRASTEGESGCKRVVVALDPGHNPLPINSFDPVTGAAQIDYSNGREDHDDLRVAKMIKADLESENYQVVLLKTAVSESVSYRERVTRAEHAGAALAVSIHTSPGVNQVFPQRVGLYREGVGADGVTLRVTYTSRATAEKSLRYARTIASSRSREQGVQVTVTDNDFGGRPLLWSGNIPIISLISDKVPWVYNEYGTANGGGSYGLPDGDIQRYAAGVSEGIKRALPVTSEGCAQA